MPTSVDVAEKPIEFWITKCTDPYVEDSQRSQYAEKLCERVNYEVEGASVATSILSHKVLSPNQLETLNSLKAIDLLVRRCGSKVHTKVGKFRFLNQLVKLISPKYQGNQSSQEVKQLTVQLLYTWQKSMRHVEKFKEVYDNLREHGVIKEDPQIESDEVLHIPNTVSRAVFEDEEKSRLLKELLASSNPDDLQAANRLIKSLVRSEDQKVERRHKRQDDIDHALKLADAMDLYLFELDCDLGMGDSRSGGDRSLCRDVKDCFNQLCAARPALFKYAGDAAESEEDELADILAANDAVNRAIQRYKAMFEGEPVRIEARDKEESRDLLGSEMPETSESHEFTDFESAPPAVDDVPFLEFGSKTNTPMVVRRVLPQNGDKAVSDLSSLFERDLFAVTPAPTFHQPKPTLNDLQHQPPAVSLSPLDPFAHSFESQTEIRALPEIVTVPLESLHMAEKPPIVIMDKCGLRLLAHFATNSPAGPSNTLTTVVTLVNFNCFALENVQLEIETSNPSISCRLERCRSNGLARFQPGRPVPASHLVLLVLPLDHRLKEAEFDFSVSYSHMIAETVSGAFTLQL